MYSPVTGEVVEVNSGVDADDFAKMKKDAYGAGWLIKVKVANTSELNSLKDLAAYEKQLADSH